MQVAIAVTRYMLISHFSLYMKCFTKPLIAATLLAVWVFSFGWMVNIGKMCRGTTKVRNSGLGPDPDQSAKNGPE